MSQSRSPETEMTVFFERWFSKFTSHIQDTSSPSGTLSLRIMRTSVALWVFNILNVSLRLVGFLER
ncbi:MAG: hypothetical protein ACD_37C00494G0001 [uncultured bacterium]|nr:MAG: hypothetical protein ACD_37C00494G0001 [uncultured bacterium]